MFFEILLPTIFELMIYVSVGIIAMVIGYFIIDLVIPVDFAKGIKEENKAVGWLTAGIYIGLGLIIKSAVMTVSESLEYVSLMIGVIDTVFFALIGIILFIIAYYLVDLVNSKYKFNEELNNKNEALGIMVFGIFIGIALIVSGVIA